MQGISGYILGGDLDLSAIPDISIEATFPKCSNYLSTKREAALTLLNTSFNLSLSFKLGPAPVLGHLDGDS